MQRKIQLLTPLFFAIFLLMSNIGLAHAQNISLTEVDDALGSVLGVGAFVGGLILTIAIAFMILGFYGAVSKGKFNPIGTAVLGILILGFAIAVGWLDYFFIIAILLIIAVLFGIKGGSLFGDK